MKTYYSGVYRVTFFVIAILILINIISFIFNHEYRRITLVTTFFTLIIIIYIMLNKRYKYIIDDNVFSINDGKQQWDENISDIKKIIGYGNIENVSFPYFCNKQYNNILIKCMNTKNKWMEIIIDDNVIIISPSKNKEFINEIMLKLKNISYDEPKDDREIHFSNEFKS